MKPTLKQGLRWFGVVAGLGVVAACGDIVRPGDNVNRSGEQATVVLTEPDQTTGNTGAASGEFAGPALPVGIEIVTTPSGLQYADTQVGTGATAEAGQVVNMYYTGYLMDGTVFDSNTSDPGFQFPLGGGQVIAGWDEGIVGMKEGGKRRLIIPAELGYGAGGSGPIPANATLVFDVELVKIGQ